jgi:YD repeat-containing protein
MGQKESALCKVIDAPSSKGAAKIESKVLGGPSMFKSFIRASALVLGLFFTIQVSAGVNVNNGNYYVANTDFYFPTAGLNIEFTRTYNSRSSYVQGFFGVGWSSELEGYLRISGSSIEYYEGGGGNIISFAQDSKNKAKWVNSLYGLQTLTQQKETYVLENAVGKVLSFNKEGRLIRVADKNGNFIDVVYKGKLIEMLRDNFNNQVRVSWKDFGGHPRIVRIERDSLKASYNYSNIGNLTKAVGIDAVPYVYEYDDEHNMTKITYANGEYKAMAYNKSRDWITRFRDRDGMVTTYDYFADSLDPENKFGTIVTRFQEGSKDSEASKFWYEFRKRADGSKFNYRSVTSIRNIVTETIFTECCGTPLVVSQWPDAAKAGTPARNLDWTVAKGNKTTTSFEYFPDGLLKKKTAPNGTVTALTYDPRHRKVSSVQTGARKISYTYDAKGNLATAHDHSENRKLELTYDLQGRITVVKETVPRAGSAQTVARNVFFRYDGGGRPIEIKERSPDGSEGVIRMKYTAQGEVEGVFNGQGRALASESDMETARNVAITFQNLLEIVQPAGVTLGPEG